MSDEPTGWELQRTLDAIRADLRDMRGDINARLDKVVTSELFAAHIAAEDGRHAAHQAEIKAIKDARESDAKQRSADRKWLVGALVFPLVVGAILLIVQVRIGA